jgi:DNA-binding response OmpR family regulator
MAVLSDINMLGMDSLLLLSEIKQRCAELSLLMVTAYGDEERRHHARGLGAFDFITKPVDFAHLRAQLPALSLFEFMAGAASTTGRTSSKKSGPAAESRSAQAEYPSARNNARPVRPWRSPRCHR